MSSNREESWSWAILHCNDDDSHTLVSHDQVICDESAKVGDLVKFVYQKKIYKGRLAAKGDDHADMTLKLDELNSRKPKRESSFHADKPRRAAISCKDRSKAILAPRSSKSLKSRKVPNHASKGEPSALNEGLRKGTEASASIPCKETASSHEKKSKKSSGPKQTATLQSEPSILGKVLSEMDDSFGSDSDEKNLGDPACGHTKKKGEQSGDVNLAEVTDANDSNSSENDGWTPEERALFLKLSRKNKSLDLQMLSSLSKKEKKPLKDGGKDMQVGQVCKESSHIQREATEKKAPALEAGQSFSASTSKDKDNGAHEINTDVHQESSDYESDSSDDNISVDSKKLQDKRFSVKRPKIKRRKYMKVEFEGEFFLHKSSDEGVVKLASKYSVYVDASKLKKLKHDAKTPNALARGLVKAVYTPAATEACSVTGRPSTGKGSGENSIRPALHPHGIEAIYAFVHSRALKRNWTVPSLTSVKKSISDVLCEDRYFTRLQQQQQEVDGEVSTESNQASKD